MKYRSNTHTVRAIQWTGDNRKDIERFFMLHGFNPFGMGLRFSDDDDRYDGADNPHIIQFYLWDDDQEVELSDWITIHTDETRHGRVMPDTIFRSTYH